MNRLVLENSIRRMLGTLVGRRILELRANPWEVLAAFDDCHLRCTLVDAEAASQNDYDEVIWTDMAVVEGPVETASRENSLPEIVATNLELTQVLVASTVVHFSDYRTFDTVDRTGFRLRHAVSKLASLVWPSKRRKIAEVVARMTVDSLGGNEEFTTNPDRSDIIAQLDRKAINIVEPGIVLVFDEECLPVFSEHNAFCFPLHDRFLRPTAGLLAEFGRNYGFEDVLAAER